jgi:type I restriction enzyme S subunit
MKGWTKQSLGDLCDVVGGGTPSKDIPAFYSGHIPWATVRDMRQEVITETECRITKEAVHSSATNIIPAGNVVIATRVGLGKVCLLGQDTAINQDLRGIIPRDTKTLAVRFLFWWLKTMADTIIAEGTGATVQGVKLPFIKSLQIPIPPLSEQQRIVEVLDEAFAGLATAQSQVAQNLQNARALFESHLQAVFTQCGPGWVETKLGEVADLLDCLHKTPTYAEAGFPMVRVTDIKPGFLDVSKTRKVDQQTFVQFSKGYSPKIGDIVFSRVGSCGVSALVNSNELFCLGQNTVFILPKINSMLLYHFLNSPNAKAQFEGFIDGTTQPTISMKSIRQVLVPIAPSHEQNRLVAQLDALSAETRRLTSLYERKKAALEALKKSLLHQAFAGEL